MCVRRDQGRTPRFGFVLPRPARLGQDGFGFVFFDFEVVDDESLAPGGVLAHVEGEHVFDRHALWDDDGVEADVLADEVLELVGGDFAEAFEAGDLGLGRSMAGVWNPPAVALEYLESFRQVGRKTVLRRRGSVPIRRFAS